MTVRAPGRSKELRLARWTESLAMTAQPTTNATQPTGTLTQKMKCQLLQVVMAPPRSTPPATPRLPTAPHMANAALRWDPAYVVVISDRADGVSRAALRPWMVRVAISWLPPWAKPLNSEATVNRARPVRNPRRRDTRSAMRPPSRSAPPDIIR